MANHITNGTFETNTATTNSQTPFDWTAANYSPDLNTEGSWGWNGNNTPADLDAAAGSGYVTLATLSNDAPDFDEAMSTTLNTPVQAGGNLHFSALTTLLAVATETAASHLARVISRRDRQPDDQRSARQHGSNGTLLAERISHFYRNRDDLRLQTDP